MKKLSIIVLFLFTSCTSSKVIYMPFLPPAANSAGRDLFQFYGYEDSLGRWHEWGFPVWKAKLATPSEKQLGSTYKGPLPPISFFGQQDSTLR